ncbi:sel1 repeat family protein [Piscinibacter gummiphilus]|uniref:Uncharacterized protein n=1 Tax=Piscinibacter gummiphilus TaxID=946333 RepID=A0A1W6LDJ0_9BURK|nr:sel1 repeat family protein [Piscinibacter gummiphilus]ARN22299.1 hypothetical protein A4W93_21670 [Piscinibacter gummiphilus]ATU66988.1 sel1 repeat family protein [Piscinibacter gummiphilus]GLS94409.1 hypothetical protein GCM10007918_17010 [Piscinibacter gummiphilus]
MRFSIAVPLAALAVASSATAAAAAPCQEPELESVASDDPECHFYKGTRHFREKDYQAALQEWLAVMEAKELPKELEYLRLNAQNNLGYLYYMGLGVRKNTELAIQQYWLPAEKAGHEEAAYHLCHAYAEENRNVALGYCREALRRYGRLGETDEGDAAVVAQLRRYISHLEGR